MNVIIKLIIVFAIVSHTYAKGVQMEYTIIVCSTKNIENANNFIKKNLKKDKNIYVLKKVNQYPVRYRVAYGSFKNFTSAKKAKAMLPSKIKRLKPYIDELKNTSKRKKYLLVKKIEPKKEFKAVPKVKVTKPKEESKPIAKVVKLKQNKELKAEPKIKVTKPKKDTNQKTKEPTKKISKLQNEYFMGANIIRGKVSSNVSATANEAIAINNSADNNINFKVGTITNNNRFTIATGKKLDTMGMQYSSTTLGYDRLLGLYAGYIPFAGVHIGKGKIEDELFGNKNMDEYGMQAGIMKNINKNLQFEIGMIITIFSDEIKATNRSGTYQDNSFTNLNGTRKIENFSGIYTGLNYKF